MNLGSALLATALAALPAPSMAAPPAQAPPWTIYVTNDNCPDYTWGLTEGQTRKAFADIVAAHLDLMKQTDDAAPQDRDRYNMAVTQEALCFLEHYPARRDELVARIREGRLYVSPFLCNSLWGFQGIEGFLRTLYPAARLGREWGLRKIEVAEHIEEPSLPWGVASLLAGCGIRWLSVPFFNYDSTFGSLDNPPVFILEGPDGSRLRVVMDPWACNRASYMQGARLLEKVDSLARPWTAHYEQLGPVYGAKAILVSGTHGDISPHSGAQAAGFARRIRDYNARKGRAARLVNAALPQFCAAIDEAQQARPFLATLKGCFGHSWDLWPVCLAKYAADMRQGERDLLAAETLLAVAAQRGPEILDATQAERRRAEWCLAMLSDHAWNGTDEENRRHNAGLRRAWSQELAALNVGLLMRAGTALGLGSAGDGVVAFNPLSFARDGLVRVELHGGAAPPGGQLVREDEASVVYLPARSVPAFGLANVPPPSPTKADGNAAAATSAGLAAAPGRLEGPFYRLVLDPEGGGVTRLVHKPTGTELAADKGRAFGQTTLFAGQDHSAGPLVCRPVAEGPLLARVETAGKVRDVSVRTLVTVYRDGDRVDFDVRLTKPVATGQERICQAFPVALPGGVLRAETTGAVIRPRRRPEGDLLPGADTRRLAVQGFVDVSAPGAGGVTIVPLDAFMLRLDEEGIVFEAVGNDQNYREVVRDQGGVTEFRFRYALRVHASDYDGAAAAQFSREVAFPLLAARGTLAGPLAAGVGLDPARAVATCLKPADTGSGGGMVVRIWETAGTSGPVRIRVPAGARIFETDLLERDRGGLAVSDGHIALDLPAHGFGAVRIAR